MKKERKIKKVEKKIILKEKKEEKNHWGLLL
jgi:hypothetical protein